jgi:hypothetical protein
MKSIFCGAVAIILATSVTAQQPVRPTLRERVAKEQTDINVTINVDGPAPTFSQVLSETHVVVQGKIGQGVSRLSRDEQDIMTTYHILDPRVVFSASPQRAARPGEVQPAVTITLSGGTVRIGSFSATVAYDDMPQLRRGAEVIALLTDREGQFVPSNRVGLFEVRDGRVVPVAPERGEHQKYAGMTPDDFLGKVVTSLNKLRSR